MGGSLVSCGLVLLDLTVRFGICASMVVCTTNDSLIVAVWVVTFPAAACALVG